MKFKYSYETLLRHRNRLEDVARREFLEAKDQVDRCLQGIKELYRQIDDARIEISQRERTDPNSAMRLKWLDEFIIGQYKRIEIERKRARELMQIRDEKNEALIVAAREAKVLEKIKEKRHQEFRKKKKKLEEKALDELVTMRFKGMSES